MVAARSGWATASAFVSATVSGTLALSDRILVGPRIRSPMILYLAADLLWASKIKGTAEAAGIPARPVRSLDMLEARLADAAPVALILDLDKPEEAMAMLARLRGPQAGPADRAIRVLAFGPHVAKDLLQAARDAGADAVLTRGAFDHDMTGILLKLASSARV